MLHYVAQLSAALAKQFELEVTVLLPEAADTRCFSKQTKLHFVKIPDKLSLMNLAKVASGATFFSLYAAIKATKPDIIHINSSHPLLIMMLPLLSRKFKIVATVHDAVPHPGTDKNLRKHLERRAAIRNARIIFVHREKIRSQLIEHNAFLKKVNILITPHGDYNLFSTFETDAIPEPATLLFFGRISRYKGLEYLIDAVSLIRDRHPDLRVIIAGGGDPGKRVSAAFNDTVYEVHNRFIDDTEIADFFTRSTIVVLPYIEASESGVIQIAKVFKKPVVSTRVGGIPEAVMEGKTGLLVDPEDPAALAEALDSLLSDEDLRKQMGENIEAENTVLTGWKDSAEITTAAYKKLYKA